MSDTSSIPSGSATKAKTSVFSARKKKVTVLAGLGGLCLALAPVILSGNEPKALAGRGMEPGFAQSGSSNSRVRGGSRAASPAAPAANRRASGSLAGRNPKSGDAVSSERDGSSDISVQVEFDSSPATVRKAITKYVKTCYPQAASYLKWDDTGTSVSASNLGASGSITLSGSGPTVVQINGDIGFPASLFVSERLVRMGLNQAIRDIKKRTS